MPEEKDLFYDRFADRFDAQMNRYDLEKRLEVVFRLLPGGDGLRGKELLDAGCGTGWLEKVKEKCESRRVEGSLLSMPFSDAAFDFIICTEAIEHTPDPRKAVDELCRTLKPGGTLVLTVPNRTWHFLAVLANVLRLRPYEGRENWVRAGELCAWLEQGGCEVELVTGFHPVPIFFRSLAAAASALEKHGNALRPLMLNLAARAVKKRT
jgi:2-polyprenyl-3-methyl-5-hydroxy-6-metoxy-1,4-benzoquinol methylase